MAWPRFLNNFKYTSLFPFQQWMSADLEPFHKRGSPVKNGPQIFAYSFFIKDFTGFA
jgi:hypothetical protein